MALRAIGAVVAFVAPLAFAHSASDAYLTLEFGTDNTTLIKGQWDIALRDLDFVLGLDADGDGNISWGEVRRQQSAIDRYAYSMLATSAGGKPCTLRPTTQRISQHADGAYAALSFDITCPADSRSIALDYRLFFAIDPSHRCILVARRGSQTATALLSPTNAKVELNP